MGWGGLLLSYIPDKWHDGVSENLRRHRADVLVGNMAILRDDEGFRHAVNAPIDGRAPVDIGPRSRVWIAHGIEPSRGIVGLILVVETMNGNDARRLQLHEHRMLFPACGAPRGEDVDQ